MAYTKRRNQIKRAFTPHYRTILLYSKTAVRKTSLSCTTLGDFLQSLEKPDRLRAFYFITWIDIMVVIAVRNILLADQRKEKVSRSL